MMFTDLQPFAHRRLHFVISGLRPPSVIEAGEATSTAREPCRRRLFVDFR